MRGHELMSHAEQIPQGVGCDAGHANQHGVVIQVVVRRVVSFRLSRKK